MLSNKSRVSPVTVSLSFRSVIWPLVIFATGVALRVLWLGEIPGGLNQDEASVGYDAWALLQSGIDRNGMRWPVNFIAWGSGQNVLYGYLSMPFIAAFDLSVLSIRLASALWGILSLWIFWRLGKLQDEKMALWALLVLVTSPWHIMASRWALESNIVPAIVLLALYLLARSPEHLGRRLPVAAAVLTLSVYAYGTAYFFAPVFLLCALLLIYRHVGIHARTLLMTVFLAFVVALPMMLFLANNAFGSGHLHLGPITIPHYSSEMRHGEIFLPFVENGWARIPHNTVVVLRLVFGGGSDGLPWNAVPFWGAQYVFLTPFVVLGLWSCFKPGASLTDRLMLAWFLCAFFTACCTEANINRINLVWLPSLWLAARGLRLMGKVEPIATVAQVIVLLCGLGFGFQYFSIWSAKIGNSFFVGLGDAIKRIDQLAPPNAPIVITRNANMPYIFVLFYSKTKPEAYIETAVIPNRQSPFQDVQQFTRYRIGIKPAKIPENAYWVAHVSELNHFSSLDYNVETYGKYAAVTRKSENE